MQFQKHFREYKRLSPWLHTAHGVVLTLIVIALLKFLLSPAPGRPEAQKSANAAIKSQPKEAPEENGSQEAKDRPKKDEAIEAQVEVFKQIFMQEAARQQQAAKADEFRRFQEQAAKGRVCPGCQGAQTYRYVDGRGQLVFKTCPYCNGTGKR